MAIDLRKLYVDIRSDDDDMKVLAMRTMKRLNEVVIARNVPLVLKIRQVLERLADEGSDEVKFFASESLDYLDKYSKVIVKKQVATDVSTKFAIKPSETGPSTSAVLSGAKGSGTNADKALRFLAKGTSKPAKAIGALKILQGNISPKHLPVVRKYLKFKVPKVRLAAAKVIISAGDERAMLEALLPHINDRSHEVRDLCLEAITSIEPESLFVAIETMIRSSQINVKVAAVFILAHMHGSEVVKLLELASHDKNEEVRSRVVDALKGRKGFDVLAVLKRLVNDLDIDVAEKALVLYEKLKELEGVKNSSLEFSNVIMDKLNEISDQEAALTSDDDSFKGAVLPESSSERVKIGTPPNQLQQFPVPKKIKTSSAHLSQGTSVADDFDSAALPDGKGTVGHVSDMAVPAGVANGIDMSTDSSVSDSEDSSVVLKSISEYPEEIQQMSDEIYDQLDAVLEDMGRQVWRLEKSNRISNRRFSKIVYDIQKYEDMLEKRNERSAKEDGFFARLSAGNRMIQEKQQIHLEFSLAELYRRLGEIAIEISISGESHFAELEEYYSQVEALLAEVHSLKEMHEL